ncbi:hypothetical protein LY90DRAFT_459992 [Neocallimastix californiae]|uniref:N-acetyltransferase domain-containing protein n=1 Tax=Neocallimastix californiae TaxID=1754190 RepID=A0A1Y2BHB9_9FUNG|nr:hypothetical protein LY90DRAFT_459992 [Neocallimastix californiae]|eukprot:ORY34181.1 hypothetical protein LY90DRAFT_459992 [Neocallimastix californiae]
MNIKGKKENNKNTERIINQNNIIKSKDSFNSQLASESTTSSSYTLSSRSISDSLSSKTDITDEFIISSSHNKINNNADLYKYISSINTSSQINENEINSKNILNSKESDIFIYKNEQNKLLNNELQENQKKQFKNNSNDYTIKNKINNQIYFSLQKQKINDLEEKEYSKVRSSNILSHQVNRGKNDTIIDKNQENNINKIKSDNNDYNNNNNSNNLNYNNNKDNKDNNIIFNYTYNENKNNDNQFSISEESSSEMTFELERNSFKHTVDYSESDTDFSSKSSDSFKNSNENNSNKGLSHPIRGGKGKQPRKGKGFYSGSKSVLQTNNTKFDEYQSDYESISDDSFNEDLNENKIKKLKDIPIINLEKENSVMKQLKIHLSSSKIARRIYRKLQIRKIKRTTQTPIFNIDRYMKNYLASKVELSPISNIKFKRYQIISVKKTEYKNSFKYRLFGKSLDYKHSLDIPIISKYTGIKLMPYIYRNYDMKPPKLKLLEDIVTYYNRNNPKWIKPKSSPIDFVHLQKEHVNTVNEMLCQAFWPGINVSEQLMFPDFSIIAMYKHLIIGCAFITPEAYITYIYVRPEWGNSGIGKFMLYYLIQSCIGKDITLHVSANNKAMLLYQKFGFKAEEFNMNFYEKYLPADSIECKNAFLLRLRR